MIWKKVEKRSEDSKIEWKWPYQKPACSEILVCHPTTVLAGSARLQDTSVPCPAERNTHSKRLFLQTLLTDSFLFKTYVSLVTHIQVNELPTKHLCYWHAPQEKVRLGANLPKAEAGGSYNNSEAKLAYTRSFTPARAQKWHSLSTKINKQQQKLPQGLPDLSLPSHKQTLTSKAGHNRAGVYTLVDPLRITTVGSCSRQCMWLQLFFLWCYKTPIGWKHWFYISHHWQASNAFLVWA